MNIRFETDQYVVRPFIITDAQGIFELDTDPEVMKFLGGVSMTSIEEAQKLVDDILWQYQEFGTGRLAIIDKASKEFIGWTGIKRERKLRDFVYYDVGYRLKHKFWGQGIATETAKYSLQFGFLNLGLKSISAAADKQNFASQKVLQKIGLKADGTFFYLGEEHFWYNISKEDWEQLNFKM